VCVYIQIGCSGDVQLIAYTSYGIDLVIGSDDSSARLIRETLSSCRGPCRCADPGDVLAYELRRPLDEVQYGERCALAGAVHGQEHASCLHIKDTDLVANGSRCRGRRQESETPVTVCNADQHDRLGVRLLRGLEKRHIG
jgi:hypothetical protein